MSMLGGTPIVVAQGLGLRLERGERPLGLFEIPLHPPDAAGGDALTHLLHRRARILGAIGPARLEQPPPGDLGAGRRRLRSVRSASISFAAPPRRLRASRVLA